MDPKRQGEIALKMVKYFMHKKGIMISENIVRELGNAAKVTEVPMGELKQFVRLLAQEVLDEHFPAEQCSENQGGAAAP